MRTGTKWLIGFIVFYGIQLSLSLFFDVFAPWKDFTAATIVLLVLLAVDRHIRIPAVAAILFGISFLPHLLGLYNIIPYDATQIGTLYGAPQLNYHYDWFVHTFASVTMSIAFLMITYRYFIQGFKSNMLIFVIVLFFIIGLGAFNEILEYVGFDALGYGQGFLEFGAGDFSPTQGPWENSMMDMVCNLLGATFGTGFFLLCKRYKPI
jgi:uncharacterized membrane protein YjdF